MGWVASSDNNSGYEPPLQTSNQNTKAIKKFKPQRRKYSGGQKKAEVKAKQAAGKPRKKPKDQKEKGNDPKKDNKGNKGDLKGDGSNGVDVVTPGFVPMEVNGIPDAKNADLGADPAANDGGGGWGGDGGWGAGGCGGGEGGGGCGAGWGGCGGD